jgi:hypothetical protein
MYQHESTYMIIVCVVIIVFVILQASKRAKKENETSSHCLKTKTTIYTHARTDGRTYHPFVVIVLGILSIIGIIVSTIVVVHGTLLDVVVIW